MRLSFFTTLALASTVYAVPSPQQPEVSDVKFVLDGYKIILDNAHKLIKKVTALKPGDDVIARLKEMSTLSRNTVKTTEKMIKDINIIKNKISISAARQITLPSAEVAVTTVTIINNLVAKKDLFIKTGVHKIILKDLNYFFSTSAEFIAAAKSKIFDNLLNLANPYFQQLQDALAKGIKNFS
jgi:hypothetical protein